RWSKLCLAAGVLAAFLLIGVAYAVPSTSILRVFSCFGFDSGHPEQMPQRYAMVIWHNHPAMRLALTEMKKGHPDFKTLMYRDTFCVLAKETPLEESVGEYDWILANHPDWFQKDTRGRRIEVPDYPGEWVMDFANPGWQEFWIRETLKDVIAGGWDGVFADDVLTSVQAHAMPPLARYPDDGAYQAAVYQFLARAYAEFRKAGKLFIANISNSYDYPGLLEKWLEVTDGYMEEHFAGEAWGWGDDVAHRQLEASRLAVQKGKWVLHMTYGPWSAEKKMRASLAAHLTVADRDILWCYRPVDKADEAPWHPLWQIDLGKPLGGPEVNGPVWSRRFERGISLVNTSKTTQTFSNGPQKIRLKPFEARLIQEKTPPSLPSAS
ncbi:MAG: putative glycoside hydrolase, partial [Candidatus Omnitrophica bacterium]|nr:putative glycoside hydrolase [Candidatus Omnitrophota bacterium]